MALWSTLKAKSPSMSTLGGPEEDVCKSEPMLYCQPRSHTPGGPFPLSSCIYALRSAGASSPWSLNRESALHWQNWSEKEKIETKVKIGGKDQCDSVHFNPNSLEKMGCGCPCHLPFWIKGKHSCAVSLSSDGIKMIHQVVVLASILIRKILHKPSLCSINKHIVFLIYVLCVVPGTSEYMCAAHALQVVSLPPSLWCQIHWAEGEQSGFQGIVLSVTDGCVCTSVPFLLWHEPNTTKGIRSKGISSWLMLGVPQDRPSQYIPWDGRVCVRTWLKVVGDIWGVWLTLAIQEDGFQFAVYIVLRAPKSEHIGAFYFHGASDHHLNKRCPSTKAVKRVSEMKIQKGEKRREGKTGNTVTGK